LQWQDCSFFRFGNCNLSLSLLRKWQMFQSALNVIKSEQTLRLLDLTLLRMVVC